MEWRGDTINHVQEVKIPEKYGTLRTMVKTGSDLWVIASSGLIRIDDVSDSISFTGHDLVILNNQNEVLNNYNIHRNVTDLWISAENAVMVPELLPPDEIHTFPVLKGELIQLDSKDKGIEKNAGILHVIRDDNGRLFIRTSQGIFAAEDGKIISIYQFKESGTRILERGMLYDPSGFLWVGTETGLLKIVIGSRPFHVIRPDPGNPEGLNDSRLNQVLVDRNDQLWVGTIGNGLYRGKPEMDGTYRTFDHFIPVREAQSGSEENSITSIYEDAKGRLYCTTPSSLYFLENITGPVRFVDSEIPGSPYNFFTGISETCDGKIIVLNSWSNSWLIDLTGGPGYPVSISDHLFRQRNNYFYRTRDNECYYKTSSGLYLLDGPFILSENEHPNVEDGLRFVCPEKKIPLLNTSSLGSVGRFIITQQQTEKEFWIQNANESSVLRYRLVQETTDSATGAGRREPKMVLLNRYTDENGLSHKSVYDFLKDHKDRIWISSQYGLTCINTYSDQITRYYRKDGLPVNQFYWGCTIDRKGRLYFCTTDGLVWFHPDSISKEPPPPLCFTGFRLFNKSMEIGRNSPLSVAPEYTDRLVLDHDQNSLSIEFVAIDYSGSEDIRYQYMMEGIDPHMVFAGANRMASYSSLRPGKYTFRVIASNSKGYWNREGAAVEIIISSPPWLTWWAILMYISLAIFIVLWFRQFLISRARLRSSVELEKKEKEKIRELEQVKSHFFTNISHEFRTPLTLLIGPLEDLARQRKGNIKRNHELYNLMLRNARRLRRLINQLLEVARIETGEVRLQVSQGNLEEFVRTIILSFISLAESRQISLRYKLPGSDRIVFFDQEKVEKILNNLISNALKFTPKEGNVSVTMNLLSFSGNSEPRFAEFMVKDSGKGIPEDKLGRIFERFYREVDDNLHNDHGTGIGLTLVKELTDLYRGEVLVNSEPGKGSVFSLRLPVASDLFRENEFVGQIHEETLEERKTGGEDIIPDVETKNPQKPVMPDLSTEDIPLLLVVDDNADLRNYVSKCLGTHCEIITAENASAGLEQARQHLPDLVISDVMMAGMDGIELCNQLKTDDRTGHIPVILLTARADKETKIEGLETGADDYIIKPFDSGELEARVANLIQQRRSFLDRFRKEYLQEPEETLGRAGDNFPVFLLKLLSKHLADAEFNIDQLADELHLSRSQLYRKVRASYGQTPNELLRTLRLKKAAFLFRSGQDHVARVMHQVGFNNQSYFSKCFKNLFGMNPKEYINRS